MGVHLGTSGLPIEGFKYELVVVVPANCKGNNISALQVQNSAEIGFLAPGTIFHFCNIGTLLLIYRF